MEWRLKRFLLQAVQNDDHLAPAREVFSLAGLDRAIISTAFMTASGLSLLEAVLHPIAERTRIFVGIRNGVTTVQSIQKALEIGCETYMVDTGTRNRIFHPKLYYSRSPALGRLLLGSANLTMGGLRTNIEASVLQEFDGAEHDSVALMDDLEAKLSAMIVDFPEHVIRAVDNPQLAALQASGRLVDERKTRPPEPAGSSENRDLDVLPKMALKTKPIAVPKPAAPPAAPTPPVPAAATPTAGAPGAAAPAATAPASIGAPITAAVVVAKDAWEHVWQSDGLTERHLNIPTGGSTNRTGSMLFGLGAWENIDHQYYFRNEVFSHLIWTADATPGKEHLERAWADFRMLIKDIDYGIHNLKLTHNTLDTEKIRQARNSKTQLHWGDTRPLVAKRDLLDGTLDLFRSSADPSKFMLVID